MNTAILLLGNRIAVRALLLGLALAALSVIHAQTVYVSVYHTGLVDKVVVGGSTTQFASGISYPTGVVFDTSGNLVVASAGSHNIWKYPLSGGSPTTFASGLTDDPTGLAYDNSGNLYVSSNLGNIKKVASNGTVSPFVTTSDSLYGMTFDTSGNLYVANWTTDKIYKIASGTSTMTEFIAFGGNDNPTGLAFDSSGNLFVSLNLTGKIAKFASDGTSINPDFVTGRTNPGLMAYDGTDLFVVQEGALLRISSSGGVSTLQTYGLSTAGGPWGVAVAAIPEPSTTAALIGLAASGLALLRRRRARPAFPRQA